jgi:hypothetical protein
MNTRSNALVLSSFLVLAAACSSSPTSAAASTETHGPDSHGGPSVPAAHQPLDGKVFEVVLVQSNGQKDPDQLVFDSATFESLACRPYGFKPASYSAHMQGSDVAFESSPKSKDAGANMWKGTVRGSSVSGSMTCTGPKGEAMSYTFEGKLANGALDGRTYEVQMVGADGKPQEKDDVSFMGGSFDSSSCRPFGFIRTAYTTTKDGDAIRFQAVAGSADYPMNHWEGTVRGDMIEGTLKSGDAADAPTLRFTGKRKS